jgi:hypothetical protein
MEAHRVVRMRLPHFLHSQLTGGGEVVSVGHPFTRRKIPGAHFYYRLSRPQGHSAAERIRSTEKSSDFIGNQTHDLPACSIVPQPCNGVPLGCTHFRPLLCCRFSLISSLHIHFYFPFMIAFNVIMLNSLVSMMKGLSKKSEGVSRVKRPICYLVFIISDLRRR